MWINYKKNRYFNMLLEGEYLDMSFGQDNIVIHIQVLIF